ncbi:MAG: transglutaminase family protein [Planctomycetota bacterium]
MDAASEASSLSPFGATLLDLPTERSHLMSHPEQTRPLPSAIEAAVSLLADADPRVVAACREQVLRWGAAALPVLRRAAKEADPRLRVRSRSLLRTLFLRDWLDRVRRFSRVAVIEAAQRRATPGLLERGLLLLAEVGFLGDADCAGESPVVLAAAERDAEELRLRVRGRTAASSARALGQLLARERGWSAEGVSYYELGGVVLDTAVDRRRAVPLVLALWYVIVGRRAGLRVAPVELPDHWLVRVHGARPVLVDPGHDGTSLTKGDCIRHLRTRGYVGAASSQLADVDDGETLQAYVDSLARVFGYREDGEVLRALHQAGEALAPLVH